MNIIRSTTESIPTQPLIDGVVEETIVTAVLTGDGIGQKAVYVGIGSNEWVMRNGTKCNHREALRYFPLLPKEDYRK